MSELKSCTYDDMIDGDADTNIEYYSKSEADNVLAEKDAEIAQLQAMLEKRNSQIAKLTQSLEQVKRAARTLRKKMNGYIHHLEEERRWRKFSEEKPKVEEGYGEIFLVAVETESNTNPKGSYVTSAEFCDGEWYNDVTGNEIEEHVEREDCFYRSRITHWMPLPSAPKETK